MTNRRYGAAMLRTNGGRLAAVALGLIAAVLINLRFSEVNQFIRFTQKYGVDRGIAFESDYVGTTALMNFIFERGYK
jgi:hypothetical protein